MRIAMLTSLLCVLALWGIGQAQEKKQQLSPSDVIEGNVPAPPSVGSRKLDVGFEMAAPMQYPSILRSKDERLMMTGAEGVRYSQDMGQTWSPLQKLSAPVQYAIRLKSGKLGGHHKGGNDRGPGKFYTSADEGQTWQEGGNMHVGELIGRPYEGSPLIQAKSGRIFLPVRFNGQVHEGHADVTGSFGTLNGKLVKAESHAHYSEPILAFTYYSDDEGQTWQRSERYVTVWHKDGHGGIWGCDEPSIAEAANGDVLMFCRTSLGRVYIARSGSVDYLQANGRRVQRSTGQRFDNPQPTVLASSLSPCAIRRIPKTGDLLMIWNQVSGDEIRAGYRRGRLSTAISPDDGKTWQHYRTIDASGLPPTGRVEPDIEPRLVRGLDYVGVLPEDYGVVQYPDLHVVDDTVFLFWSRIVNNPRSGDVTGRRMRVLPLSWFYADEPVPPPSPKLLIKVPAGAEWNTYEIPVRFHDERFYCHSKDLAGYLKSPTGHLGRDISAPLHQVVTCMGWIPQYDLSHLKDANDPRMIVTLTHAQARPPAK